MKKSITKTDVVVLALCLFLFFISVAAVDNKGRQRAKQMKCKANLRQWANIMQMYVQDNEGLFFNYCAGGKQWFIKCRPYYNNEKILLCPTATETESEGAEQPFAAYLAYEGNENETKGSYGLNDWVLSAWHGEVDPESPLNSLLWKTPYIEGADNVPLLLDSSMMYMVTPTYSNEPPAYEADVVFGQGIAQGEMKRFCVNRHNGSVNILYMDFSVRNTGLKKLWELDFHRDWNPDNDPLPEWPEWMSDFKD